MSQDLSNTDSITLTLPIPPSINSAYGNGKNGGRFKKQAYKDWEQEAKLALRQAPTYTIEGDNWLEVQYDFHFPTHYKNGKKKVQDIANYEKALSDFLAEDTRKEEKKIKNPKVYEIKGFQDHKIKRMVLTKSDSNRNEVDVVIREI